MRRGARREKEYDNHEKDFILADLDAEVLATKPLMAMNTLSEAVVGTDGQVEATLSYSDGLFPTGEKGSFPSDHAVLGGWVVFKPPDGGGAAKPPPTAANP